MIVKKDSYSRLQRFKKFRKGRDIIQLEPNVYNENELTSCSFSFERKMKRVIRANFSHVAFSSSSEMI